MKGLQNRKKEANAARPFKRVRFTIVGMVVALSIAVAVTLNTGEISKSEIMSPIAAIDVEDSNDLPSTNASLTEVSEIRQEVSYLKREVRALRTILGHLTEKLESMGASEKFVEFNQKDFSDSYRDRRETIDLTEETLRTTLERQKERNQERTQSIDIALRNENVDEHWASEAVNTIKGAILQPRFAWSKLLEVDCRSTLCRMSVQHEDMKAKEEFMISFPMEVAPLLTRATMTHTESIDETSVSLVHFARAGHSFPSEK